MRLTILIGLHDQVAALVRELHAAIRRFRFHGEDGQAVDLGVFLPNAPDMSLGVRVWRPWEIPRGEPE